MGENIGEVGDTSSSPWRAFGAPFLNGAPHEVAKGLLVHTRSVTSRRSSPATDIKRLRSASGRNLGGTTGSELRKLEGPWPWEAANCDT